MLLRVTQKQKKYHCICFVQGPFTVWFWVFFPSDFKQNKKEKNLPPMSKDKEFPLSAQKVDFLGNYVNTIHKKNRMLKIGKAFRDELVTLLTIALETSWFSHQLHSIVLLFVQGEDTSMKNCAQWKLHFLWHLCKAWKETFFNFLFIEFPSKDQCLDVYIMGRLSSLSEGYKWRHTIVTQVLSQE